MMDRIIQISVIIFILSVCLNIFGSSSERKAYIQPDPSAWGSYWIAASEQTANYDTVMPAPWFRKVFSINRQVKKAVVKVTGLGYFEFYLNGEKIGTQVLAPSVTRYDKRVEYIEREVTNLLVKGQNVAGSIVGNGFYNVDTKSAWDYNKAPWRNQPIFNCQLIVEFTDGTFDTINSDRSWKFSTGPIIFDQVRNGEIYDANKELTGWLEADFNDDKWNNAFIVEGPQGRLFEQYIPPVKKTRIIKPIKISEPEKGIYVVDFGQNIAGWLKIKIDEKQGNEIIIRYGERIFEDGTLDQKELSRFIFTGETQTTRYVSNGATTEEYEPRFTYFGFQYVQVEGLSHPLSVDDIEAYMIHTAFDTIGYFECSNHIINKIHENILWSFLGNYHSYPEDCPHREKMGWTGDAQLVIETSLFNFDAASAYKKWMYDFMDEQREDGDLPGIIPTSGWGYTYRNNPKTNDYGQGPQWEGAAVIIPWQLYRYTGDTSILRNFYPLMEKYVNHLENVADNFLLDFGIDDHKSIKTHTDGTYISSAYFHYLCKIMIKVSAVLDKEIASINYGQLSDNIFNSFQDKYFKKDSLTYGNGGQTALSLALGCGLVPEYLISKILDKLISSIKSENYHFDAGVVGVKMVINVLLAFDRKDILYKMIKQTDFPSFGYWIEQGASTMWQNWDGSQSRNHIMFGSIGDYIYKGLAGINIFNDSLGIHQININPQFPEDMTFLRSAHKSRFGWIKVGWKRVNNMIQYSVSLPENARSVIAIPFNADNIEVRNTLTDEYKVVDIKVLNHNLTSYMLSPGEYLFEISTANY